MIGAAIAREAAVRHAASRARVAGRLRLAESAHGALAGATSMLGQIVLVLMCARRRRCEKLCVAVCLSGREKNPIAAHALRRLGVRPFAAEILFSRGDVSQETAYRRRKPVPPQTIHFRDLKTGILYDAK